MKKLLLVTFLFLSFNILSYAPTLPTIIYIPQAKPITYIEKIKVDYESLIKAIGLVESRCDNSAINLKEDARGYFQIRKCRIEHYNNLTGRNYTLQDMHNFEKAQEVFLYFVYHDSRGRIISPKSYETTAKNWNGSGTMTEKYWKLVQAKLQLNRANT